MSKTVMLCMLGLLLGCVAVLGEEAENKTLPKPFGTGHGPVHIGGRDTDQAGTQLSLKIYDQYRNYRKLIGLSLLDHEQYYDAWTDKNKCIGACPKYSFCQKGFCICDNADSVVQIFGRCYGNSTAAFVGDHEKYRKPKPPPRPEWCFCKKKNGGKDVCDQHRGRQECEVPHFPNNFDADTQFCRRGDHNHCKSKDINMFCSNSLLQDPTDGLQKNLCECAKDMTFDTKNMECRIFIDVDCTYETAYPAGVPESNLIKLLKGVRGVEPERDYSREEARTAFCNLLDSVAAEYNAHIVPEFNFTFLGLGIGGLCLVAFITCITCCCCCKCCESTKQKIRRLDPRNAMRDAGMGPGAQMAALGAVAAGEYMENRNDKQDEARVAAMQGQSMGMPGGAPPGYAPVPTGYPEGPGYPQPGPGYPPQQAPYPPQGQPGYIPPADGGPGLMNMAPELALAGAGAYTGNTAMMGMGAVAAAEKMGDMEDKEDRFRAAAIKGVPPPPMGYAGGGQPSYPQNNLPPSTANYPRM